MRTEGGQRGSGEAFTYWEVWPGFKRGGCWQRGQIPNVGLQPGLKEKGPLRWSKWFPVGSDPSVLSPTCKSFFWVLKGQSGQAISLWTSLNHIYVLSFPATPTVRALATARIQRPAKASSAGEVGGVSEKVLKLCVCVSGRESLTLDMHSKPLLPEGAEGKVAYGVCLLEVLAYTLETTAGKSML